ncbi:NTP/NDP exchange transporter [Pigmentiphaga litoralis]|uniref:NTP/NDP exchange transporter n=1 Tax=Pigmentiphaga litoralis TaxID=516702 RepID=UPI003B434925
MAAGFLLFFCLFAGYFMLRPVRETMGITGGVQHLQWLFTATFVVMLVAVPIYGAFAARVRRSRLVPWLYAAFMIQLAAFAAAFQVAHDSVVLARVFYVWVSVYNLFVVSVAWSFLADVCQPGQARRLFGPIAAGASVGGLAGPVLGGLLVRAIGFSGLLLLSAALLGASLACVAWLLGWRTRHGAAANSEAANGGAANGATANRGTADGAAADGKPADDKAAKGITLSGKPDSPGQPLGGSSWAGFVSLLRSPYLLGISAFVILLATASTFLYFEQARMMAERFPDRTRQAEIFSTIDAVVQALTILIQLGVTGRLAQRFGVRVLLAAIPLAIAAGFIALAVMPAFSVLVIVMIVRRVGEYALIRPGREMLFTVVDAETKYKAKNVIDTAVYRAGDAVSGWAKAGIDALGAGAGPAAWVGAALALLWAGFGIGLGRAYARRLRDPR